MDAIHFRMPVQRKTVEEGVKRVYLYNKEFALKTHVIERQRNFYSDNDIDFEKLKPGYVKGNEVLIKIQFDMLTGIYKETWANKTKYMRVTKGREYEQK